MRVLLFIIAVLFALWGALLFLIAKSAVHEIQAYIAWLIAIVALVGGGVVDAVVSMRRAIDSSAHDPHRYPPG